MFYLPPKELEELNQYLIDSKKGDRQRSKVIRQAIREYLDEQRW